MDPEATLSEIRESVRRFNSAEPWDSALDASDEGHRLAELVSSLDGWLTAGGFLPSAWSRPLTIND